MGLLDKYQDSWRIATKTPVAEDVCYLKESVSGRANRPGWDLNPDYQRDNVWTLRQKELFVGSFLEECLIPPVYVQRYESEKNYPEGGRDGWLDLPCEIIDGKQRIQALLDWLDGKIEAEVTCGDRICYSDLDAVDRRRLPFLKVVYLDIPRSARLEFYLRINRGGTVHTEAEIQKVRNLLKDEKAHA
jgi:hypothetical protein